MCALRVLQVHGQGLVFLIMLPPSTRDHPTGVLELFPAGMVRAGTSSLLDYWRLSVGVGVSYHSLVQPESSECKKRAKFRFRECGHIEVQPDVVVRAVRRLLDHIEGVREWGAEMPPTKRVTGRSEPEP